MKVDRLIKLTFDDSHRCLVRKGNRTIVKMTSYFKQENFDQIFNQLGFTTLPEPVLSTLKKYGYTYDYKLGGWKTTTSGLVELQSTDEDDQTKANNMVMTKAKVKAYSRATKCLNEIYKTFEQSLEVYKNSLINLKFITDSEVLALDRCIETGYCNPNKK